jgi:hypothetical protein
MVFANGYKHKTTLDCPLGSFLFFGVSQAQPERFIGFATIRPGGVVLALHGEGTSKLG